MAQRRKEQLEPREFNAFAAVMAWLIPGGGHLFVLNDRKRGLAILAGVGFMILCGTLVGGVQSVDRQEQRLWFLAQSCNGPVAFVLDGINQKFVKTKPASELDPITSFGRVQELGILFIALAGLMNLVVIVDAAHHRPPSSLKEPEGGGSGSSSASASASASTSAPAPVAASSDEPEKPEVSSEAPKGADAADAADASEDEVTR